MNVSVAFKLTIARFINSSLVLVIVNNEQRSWYKSGDLVYDATILILILCVSGPMFEIVNIQGIVKFFKKRAEMAKGEDSTMTQREANILCEGPIIDPANNISNFMNMIMTCIFYSPLIPQAIPIAMCSAFVGYWTTKYSMLRRYKMPDQFSELMATFFSNFMPWLIFSWSISAYFFLAENYAVQFEDNKRQLIKSGSIYLMQVAIAVVVVCICFPFRSCINSRINQNEALSVNIQYSSLALSFPSDYDKENPLTSKQG